MSKVTAQDLKYSGVFPSVFHTTLGRTGNKELSSRISSGEFFVEEERNDRVIHKDQSVVLQPKPKAKGTRVMRAANLFVKHMLIAGSNIEYIAHDKLIDVLDREDWEEESFCKHIMIYDFEAGSSSPFENDKRLLRKFERFVLTYYENDMAISAASMVPFGSSGWYSSGFIEIMSAQTVQIEVN